MCWVTCGHEQINLSLFYGMHVVNVPLPIENNCFYLEDQNKTVVRSGNHN